MSDAFYRVVRGCGRPCFFVSSTPTVLGVEHVPRSGPLIVVATHSSPYDIPLLIRHTPRLLDFVATADLFANALGAWFFRNLNVIRHERCKSDASTVRVVLRRLSAGRVIALFPEGEVRQDDDSVLQTGRIRRGFGRIAAMTGANVVPCVILNSRAYSQPMNWLPLRRVRYGVVYGEPLEPGGDAAKLEERCVEGLRDLNARLLKEMK